jgi:hypothetical protein
MTDFGPKSEMRWVPVNRLSVDERYQRSLETRAGQKLIGRIVEGFRWSAFHAILITPSDHGWRIIDGQHRVEAARRLGIDEVPAVVIQAVSLAEQASASLSANRDRVKLTELALHHAQLVAGDHLALSVNELCTANNITIPRYQVPADRLKPGQTLALAALRRLARMQDRTLAHRIVTTVADAYRGEVGALRSSIFQAVCSLMRLDTRGAKYGAALSQSTAAQLLREAQGYRARHGVREVDAIAEVLRQRAGGVRSIFASPELKLRAMAGR